MEDPFIAVVMTDSEQNQIFEKQDAFLENMERLLASKEMREEEIANLVQKMWLEMRQRQADRPRVDAERQAERQRVDVERQADRQRMDAERQAIIQRMDAERQADKQRMDDLKMRIEALEGNTKQEESNIQKIEGGLREERERAMKAEQILREEIISHSTSIQDTTEFIANGCSKNSAAYSRIKARHLNSTKKDCCPPLACGASR